MSQYSLGEWNLSELADDPKGEAFQRQVRRLERKSKKFEKAKTHLTPDISQEQFMDMVKDVEDISEETHKLVGYASLSYSANTQSDQATSLMTRMLKMGSEVSNRILFFDLWWKKSLGEADARRLAENAGELAEYLLYKRLLARYSLSEPEERIINTLDVTGASALTKLYDKITGAYRYKMRLGRKTKTMTREEITGYVKDPRPDVRKTAYQTILSRYSQDRGVAGEIYQNIVLNWRDEEIEIRGHKTPISARNTGNNIDDKTVESLLASCRKNAPIFQRFFAQKAGMLGMDSLRRYDLYAPAAKRAEKKYSYDRSVRMVFESLERFSPDLAGYARRVFEEDHIDSAIRPGKRDGAFCSTLSPAITPYVMVNFTGKSRDVFTLAHELGHAAHSMAAEKRSILVQDPPLPLAETASTFSELLLYDSLSEKIPDDEKRSVLSEKIDDLYATILRQSYFTVFEVDAHKQIGLGATTDEISGTYMKNLKEQFGGSVEVSDDFSDEWLYIPHFYHSPFYCYAYSFGNLLALSLFQRYKKEGRDFVPSYLSILAAGGSRKPEGLLAEHGFDIHSTGFWQNGFDYIDRQVRELSSLN